MQRNPNSEIFFLSESSQHVFFNTHVWIMWWRQRGFFSLSFLALPPWILAAEPFDWAMRRRGHQADYSARSSERINARWNKFIIDADSEAFAGMSEHEAKGFWTSGAGHGATAEQINKHDDREKYDKWVIRALLWRWKVLTWSFSKLGERGVFLPFCMCCKQVSQLLCKICSENLMGSTIPITKKTPDIFSEQLF